MFISVALLIPLLPTAYTVRTPLQPDLTSATNNAPHIFNAIHSAGRLWGTSIKQNGFGFFPAIVPRGTLLYHGALNRSIAVGPEWLAFEIEHAEVFARSRTVEHVRAGSTGLTSDAVDGCVSSAEAQKTLGGKAQRPCRLNPSNKDGTKGEGHEIDGNRRGYVHTYQATRDLNLLLIDGHSAGKSTFGTLDSQDLLLRENIIPPPGGLWGGELQRAEALCKLADAWGYDGVIRAEIGFEVIQCDFARGLRLLSATRTPMPEDTMGREDMSTYLVSRSAAHLYDGILGGRVRLDFSSMVSGFFFPINVSHTEAGRPDRIRLAAAGLDELRDIKAYLVDVLGQKRRFTVNWQDVVDMIVSRYADRLAAMASDLLTQNQFLGELDKAVLTHFDTARLPGDINSQSDSTKSKIEQDAVNRCTQHYLLGALLDQEAWSPEDTLIYTSVTTITHNICDTLVTERSSILKQYLKTDDEIALEKSITDAKTAIKDLMDTLSWTDWKKTKPCPVGEILFVTMFPVGTEEDYWSPGCRTMDEMNVPRIGYWHRDH